MLPHIANGIFAGNAKMGKIGSQRQRLVRRVEQCYGVRTVSKRTYIYLVVVGHDLALGCLAKRVLIDGDNLRIEQYTTVVLRHLAQVVGHSQRRCHHTPHTHLCLIFCLGAPYSTKVARRTTLAVKANYEHVHVRPLSRTYVFGKRSRDVHDIEYAHTAFFGDVLPHIANVIRSTPKLSAYFLTPLFALALSPLANAKRYVAARLLQGICHSAITMACRSAVFRSIAVVILQIVDIPRSKRTSILLFKSKTCCPSTTG